MDKKIEELKNAADFLKNNEYLPAAKCYANVAELLEKAGNIEEAEIIFQNIIDCYNKEAESNIGQNKHHEAAEIFLAAGELKIRLNEEDLSREYYNKAVQQFIKAAEQTLNQDDFQNAGDFFKKAAFYLEQEIQDMDLANKIYNKAIDCYQKFKNQIVIEEDFKKATHITQIIAILYERTGNYEKAIEIDNNALEMAKKRDLVQIITDCYLHMAHCYLKLDKKEKMIKTLKIAKDYNIKSGKLKMEKKNYLEASESFDNAISILKELNKLIVKNSKILEEINQSYINKADCYIKIADSNLNQAEIDRAAHFQRNAALCHRLIKKHKNAAELFVEAGTNFEKLNAKKLAAINFRDAGLQYELIKKPKTAADLLLSAAKLAKIEGTNEISIECYRDTLRNFECFDDMKKFEETLKELEELLKTLAEEEETEKNFHIAASYFFEIGNYYNSLKKPKKAEIYYNGAIDNLQKAVEIAIEEEQLTIAAYSLSCFIIIKLIVNDTNIESILAMYRNSLGENNYFKFSEDLYKEYISEEKKILEIIEKYEYIIKHSDELDYLISKLTEIMKIQD
ncbi:MAG: hypothetical protein HWN67_19795 [Candidatus Helarchaeota archaeon]|nr:hypothetical protein [Candidatus Helarchaeota archaeon]